MVGVWVAGRLVSQLGGRGGMPGRAGMEAPQRADGVAAVARETGTNTGATTMEVEDEEAEVEDELDEY